MKKKKSCASSSRKPGKWNKHSPGADGVIRKAVNRDAFNAMSHDFRPKKLDAIRPRDPSSLPFCCRACGKEFETEGGLCYHISHFHPCITGVCVEPPSRNSRALICKHCGSMVLNDDVILHRHLRDRHGLLDLGKPLSEYFRHP